MTAITKFSKALIGNNYSLLMFLMVGSCTAGLYFISFTIFSALLHGNYQAAVSLSYIICIAFQFTVNQKFTFKNKKNNLTQQIPRYMALLLFNYFITLLVVYITVEMFHYSPYLGMVLTLGFSFIFNYIVSKLWIFKAQPY